MLGKTRHGKSSENAPFWPQQFKLCLVDAAVITVLDQYSDGYVSIYMSK